MSTPPPPPTEETSDTPTPDFDLVRTLLADENGTPPDQTALKLEPEVAAEVMGAVRGAASQDAPKERIETPLPPQFNPQAETVQTLMDWVFSTNQLGKIEVTDQEKMIFWKAFIHDTTLCFDITLNLVRPVVIRVKNLTVFAQQAIAGALALDEKEELTRGPESFATQMQQYCILMQVMSIDSVAFDGVDWAEGAQPPLADLVKTLRVKMQTKMGNMPAPRLSALVKAVTIFEIKHKICSDNVVNRGDNQGFWPPLGTA